MLKKASMSFLLKVMFMEENPLKISMAPEKVNYFSILVVSGWE
jgi:hypothetical protein